MSHLNTRRRPHTHTNKANRRFDSTILYQGDENDNKLHKELNPWKMIIAISSLVALTIIAIICLSSIRKNPNYNLNTLEDISNLPQQSLAQSSTKLVDGNTHSNLRPDLRRISNEPEQKNGSIEPVILKNVWQDRPINWQKDTLMKRVGQYFQYLKDSTVQPYRTSNDGYCILTGTEITNLLSIHNDHPHNILFFTNNQENEIFMKELRDDYKIPRQLQHITGFEVFSAMTQNQSHSFHAHGESWLGQVEGRRQWWFVPPAESPPKRMNACQYRTQPHLLPVNTVTIIQFPGDIVWFPKNWYHATCALDSWTVGIGWQQGKTIRQQFPPVNRQYEKQRQSNNNITSKMMKEECIKQTLPASVASSTMTTSTTKVITKNIINAADKEQWKWFDGDLNAYYNSLTTDENQKRDPNNISSYAVHRWLGNAQNTEEHYQLIYNAIQKHHPSIIESSSDEQFPRVLDAGCGLGAGLMWMEQNAPKHWNLIGYTISEEQHKFICNTLPKHNFESKLQSFNDLKNEKAFDVIYSIEAIIHSDDIATTLREWTQNLSPGGIIVLIDDFLADGVEKSQPDLQDFTKSWLANSLVSVDELRRIAKELGLIIVEDKNLVEEYRIIEVNYRNKKPAIQPFGGRNHQGWMGSKWRQRLTVEGKLLYDMVVFKKTDNESREDTSAACAAVPSALKRNYETEDAKKAQWITPQLMSGHGDNGGKPMACISGWYCCDKGIEWYENMSTNRTEKKVEYLILDKNLFGHYMDVFARHLNSHYANYPPNATGRFLDIGGTGSTAVGMKKVTSKFQNFAGPLEYWKLDSDPAAKQLERTFYCDIDDCPEAVNCGFDVTFSHTVLEHAKRPWMAFDTIARITKKGGLTMHLVPWSYQYHATPGDHFRFSHTGLETLLKDRGFDVLEVGYDICTKQEGKLKSVDEHYDIIWLTYVVGRKM